MQDCMHEDLEEMCEIGTSFYDENRASSPINNENSPINYGSVDETIDVFVDKCHENFLWTWDNESKSDQVEIMNDDMEVQFHKSYSNGTAVVRSTEPMSNNQYYWEIKMTYPVYGTDVMVGVGTPEARIRHIQDRFVSRLGMDEQTWGFSYTGLFHHNGERRCYAQQFDQGSTIGVHLDLWKGTLSFYKDRKHLGVASSGLKGKTLYAMASSTAARSGMRIVRTCSFPSCLQFLCAAKLRELIPEDRNVLDVINFPPGLKQFLKVNLSWLLDKHNLSEDCDTCCADAGKHAMDVDEMIHESSFRSYDPYDADRRFVLLGATVLLNRNARFKRAIKYVDYEDGRESPERDMKKHHTSYYSFGLSDIDSD